MATKVNFAVLVQKYGAETLAHGLPIIADAYIATHSTETSEEVLAAVQAEAKKLLPSALQPVEDIIWPWIAAGIEPIVTEAIANFNSAPPILDTPAGNLIQEVAKSAEIIDGSLEQPAPTLSIG